MSYVALSQVQNIQGLAITNLDPTIITASTFPLSEMSRLHAKVTSHM